ncbi:MAG: amidohydrolase family protein [Armatimonadota bacterium]
MIIDAHVHIGRSFSAWRSENDAEADLVETAREVGISRLLVSSLGNTGYIHYPTPTEMRDANNHVLETIERFPNVIDGWCYVTPEHAAESLQEIRRCVSDGPMIGIKLWIARNASDASLEAIVAAAERLEVPILQHAFYKTTGNLPDESNGADVAEMARRHPGARILMAHLYGVGERGVQDIAPYPNVYLDTSGSDPESGLLEYAVRCLGVKRIVFGSDAPGRDFGIQLAKVVGAELDETQRDLIQSGNILRLLNREEKLCGM